MTRIEITGDWAPKATKMKTTIQTSRRPFRHSQYLRQAALFVLTLPHVRTGLTRIVAAAALALSLSLAGCGGGGGGGGYVIGYDRLIGTLYAEPGPDPNPPRERVSPGAGPMIVIDHVGRGSTHSYRGDRWDNTGRVPLAVYGRVFNAGPAEAEVLVYAATNRLYPQPHADSFITVKPDGTWFTPAHDGRVHALLVRPGYRPDASGGLPPVDGRNVLAATAEDAAP